MMSSNLEKVLIVFGVSVASTILILRRRRLKVNDPFVERFKLPPFPHTTTQSLSGLTFAINDVFDVKDHLASSRNSYRKIRPGKAAVVVTILLESGATCLGKTVVDELSFGISGEDTQYGTTPAKPSYSPGGSAVVVAEDLVDFAIGIDTTGGVRIPASFCGVFGFRPSYGSVSTFGALRNSQSLDTVGIFACDASVLHRVGHVLLRLNPVKPRVTTRIIVADDLFQLHKVSLLNTEYIVSKVTENLSVCQAPNHINIGQYIMSNVPALNNFCEQTLILQNESNTLKALSSAMFYLQRYEFETNHDQEQINTIKPRLGSGVYDPMHGETTATYEIIKACYKVRTEMKAALSRLLKDDGILVIPSITDSLLKLKSERVFLSEFHDREFPLSSIATMSSCCEVTVPFDKHEEDCPIGVSFIANHECDKFLLDIVLKIYQSPQDKVSPVTSLPLLDLRGKADTPKSFKEKGNAAFEEQQWTEAVSYYTEAIKLDESHATLYRSRAAAYIKLKCFQQAEEDCNKAISLDDESVKAYLRRGTARKALLRYQEAIQDFKHALVLEPLNEFARKSLNILEIKVRDDLLQAPVSI